MLDERVLETKVSTKFEHPCRTQSMVFMARVLEYENMVQAAQFSSRMEKSGLKEKALNDLIDAAEELNECLVDYGRRERK